MNFRKNGDKYLITIEAIALVVVLIVGIVSCVMPGEKVKKNNIQRADDEQNISQSTEASDSLQPVEETAQFVPSESVAAKLASMTTEEKVAQMFITHPEEITGVTTFTQAGNKTKEAIGNYPLGGFVFRQDNFYGQEATSVMMSNVQQYASERLGVQMFLAIDEEGGEKSPLAAANAYAVQEMPSQTADADSAGEIAGAISEYMIASGLNMNFSPVADIAYGDNADYDLYAFGSDSTTVSDSAGRQVQAYNEAGVFSVAKTFPGKGKATVDATTGMLWVSANIADLEASDFVAYKSVIDAGVPFIMMGNVLCQGVTGEETVPCSLSANAVSYMRQQMGFTGLLITDDLSDSTLSSKYSQDEAAVAAVKAGMNMIYISTGFEGSYNAVLDAVNSGEITAEQLDDAVGRILTTKGI